MVIILGQILLQKFGDKEITKTQMYNYVESDFTLVPQLLEGTASPKATIRYGCASVLTNLSEKHPDQLYPYMDRFIGLLDSQHHILTWNALAILANLTVSDSDCKFDALFDKYYSNLNSEYMVTVANTVANSAKIAQNKPYLSDRITEKLLEVQNLQTTPNLTDECKLVIAEKAIETFNTLMKFTNDKNVLLAFAEKYQNSTRASLRKEAQQFLKKWE